MLQLIMIAYILMQFPTVHLGIWALWFFTLFIKIISCGITVVKNINKY
jgi:hypothetical protein